MSVNEICDILSEVGLCAREYIDREINGSLSGGELKRIEIAMITARAVSYTHLHRSYRKCGRYPESG